MKRSARKLVLLMIAIMGLLFFPGAIRKVITVTSQPTAAKVWINGKYRGKTPVEIPYSWNWYYDIILKKEGYTDFCVRERFYAPVRHWVPFDFFAEAIPVRSEEPQWRNYQMIPKAEED